jgi:hypothetical protein
VPRTTTSKLTALVQRFDLTDDVNRLAADSTHHRALWDTAAAALLPTALITRTLGQHCSDEEFLKAGSIAIDGPKTAPETQQPTLFD